MEETKTIVTCYSSPDLDGLACVIAYSEYLGILGQNVIPYINGDPNIEAEFIENYLEIETPSQLKEHDTIILTDASNLNGFPKNLDPSKVVEVIDHRKFGDTSVFPNARQIQIEMVGAAATIITEKFIGQDLAISKDSAILLHQAIVSNTLDFQAKTATRRDRDAAKWLEKKTTISEGLTDGMFLAKSDMAGTKLEKNILDTFAYPFKIADKSLGIAQLEVLSAEKIVSDRKDEIIKILDLLKVKFSLDIVFATIIGLKEGINIFISDNAETKQMLETVLNIKFSNNVATREGLIMRKELVPIIMESYGRS